MTDHEQEIEAEEGNDGRGRDFSPREPARQFEVEGPHDGHRYRPDETRREADVVEVVSSREIEGVAGYGRKYEPGAESGQDSGGYVEGKGNSEREGELAHDGGEGGSEKGDDDDFLERPAGDRSSSRASPRRAGSE